MARVKASLRRISIALAIVFFLALVAAITYPLYATPRSSRGRDPALTQRNRIYNDRVEQARQARMSGDLVEAERLYRSALAWRGRRDPFLANSLAKILTEEGRKEEALEQYASILNPPPHTWTSLTYDPEVLGPAIALAEELGRPDVAAKAVDNLLEEGLDTPNFADLPKPTTPEERRAAAHLVLGNGLDGGESEGALRHFVKARQLDPDLATAWYLEGRALAMLGRFAEARDTLTEAKRLAPQESRLADLIAKAFGMAWKDGTRFTDGTQVVNGRRMRPQNP